MKSPHTTEHLTEQGPDCLQISRGGGWLSVFGIPFLAAGVFISLMALGVVVPENADELPWWAWPLLFAMGIVFMAVGGHLIFGRTRITIDRSRGVVTRTWGLIVPMESNEHSLQSYSAVVLRYDSGGSDSAERYPVVLQARVGGADLELLSGGVYPASRGQAERLSQFVRLPLVDSTTDHESVLHPESLAATFRERVRQARANGAPRPATLRTVIEASDGGVRLVFPRSGLKPVMLLKLAVPFGVAVLAFMQLIPFFEETNTPEPVQWGFLAFAALFVLVPGAGALVSIVRAMHSRTVVIASPAGIRLEERGAVKARTTDIPAESILDIDYATNRSKLESAKHDATAVQAGSPVRATKGATGGIELPRWVLFLGSLVPSKGVILKTRQGVFTFGSGLPDEEVRYLHDTVTRAVLS